MIFQTQCTARARECVCVCVNECVLERQRKRDRQRQRESLTRWRAARTATNFWPYSNILSFRTSFSSGSVAHLYLMHKDLLISFSW